MGQRSGPSMTDHFAGRLSIANKISLLSFRIAPPAAGIPVPGFDHELRILAISDGLPAGIENLLEQRVGQEFFRRARSQPVDSRTQGTNRTESVGHMRFGSIDRNGLRKGGGKDEKETAHNYRHFNNASLCPSVHRNGLQM